MATYSPILGNPYPQYFDANGAPYVGMRLFFYQAGTSTKQNTVTDSTGAVTNTNPIVLDANGYPTSSVMIYGDDSLTYKVVAAPPGSDDPPTSPLWTIDKIYPGNQILSLLMSTTLDDGTKGFHLVYYPLTSAEQTAGITPTNFEYPECHVYRYGAVGDGITDDTTAIQQAFDVQAQATISMLTSGGHYLGALPYVFFPEGRYITSVTIDMDSLYATAKGNQASLKKAAVFTGTAALQGAGTAWRCVFEGLQFEEYATGIYLDSANTNSGKILIKNCGFFDITSYGIHIDAQSTITTIEDCMFRSCVHEVYIELGDVVRIIGGWIQRGLLSSNYDGGIINYGTLYMESTLCVPNVQSITEPAWIANYGSVYCHNVRFGGESGSHSAVNNFTDRTPSYPTYVILNGCRMFSTVDDRSAIRIFDLPDKIVINDCTGMTDGRYLAWSTSISGASQTTILAAISSNDFNTQSFTINLDNNNVYYAAANDPIVPTNLLKYVKSFMPYGMWMQKQNIGLEYGGVWSIGEEDPAADVDIQISGNSTYYPHIRLENTATVISANDDIGRIDFYSNDASGGGAGVGGWIRGYQHAGSPSQVGVAIGTGQTGASSPSAPQDRLIIDGAYGRVYPKEDNLRTLGAAANRWSEVFAGNATINTSDEREKQQIRALNDKEKAVAKKLKKLVKAFKFNDAVESKGNEARIHFGVIAQEVVTAFDSEGLAAKDYSILCHDIWYTYKGENVIVQEDGKYHERKQFIGDTEVRLAKDGKVFGLDGKVIKDAKKEDVVEKELTYDVETKDRYGIRYSQLLAFIISVI